MGSPKFALDGKCKDSPGTVPSYFSDGLTVHLDFILIFNQNSARRTLNDHFAWHLLSPKRENLGFHRRSLGPPTAPTDREAGDVL